MTVDLSWTPVQQAALNAVAAWYAERDPDRPVFRLFGYAGTGKTTLARSCAKGVGGLVLYGCFTGKAALVLRQKGCLTAQTIHSMIYQPFDKSSSKLAQLKEEYSALLAKTVPPEEQRFHEAKCREIAQLIHNEEEGLKQPSFVLNQDSEVQHASIVVLDEVSMVGTRMGEDLLSFGVPILALGDPAQLPPIGDGGFFTGAAPDYMLTEIHRQAADSPVIHLATQVRESGRPLLPLGIYGESSVVPKGTKTIEEIAQGYDQIIVGMNATRRTINRLVREKVYGRTDPLPVAGDRLVCLKNHHEKGLLNGSLWNATRVMDADEHLLVELAGDGGGSVVTLAHKKPFLGQTIDYFERREADEFDFGYAITCHKSQGSQWDSVYVVNEASAFRGDAARWLYTAVTRAAEKVTVAQ